jgi:hypothetical protein
MCGPAGASRSDAFPVQGLEGGVDSFQRSTDAQLALPRPEHATGNFVKVAFGMQAPEARSRSCNEPRDFPFGQLLTRIGCGDLATTFLRYGRRGSGRLDSSHLSAAPDRTPGGIVSPDRTRVLQILSRLQSGTEAVGESVTFECSARSAQSGSSPRIAIQARSLRLVACCGRSGQVRV